MTEAQLKALGWKLVKQYQHNQYHTARYQLGCLTIEFTYLEEDLVTCDLLAPELEECNVSLRQAELLTELVGKWA
jgi:hypothetical protein